MTAPALLLRGLGSVGDLAGPRAVFVSDGKVAALGTDAESIGARADRTIEADGLVAAPGFVDLQINGAAGHDFTTDPAGMWAVGPELARRGVTAFLPTVVTAPAHAAERASAAFRDGPPADGARPGAVPLGVHLEGPFLSHARRGAHDPTHLREPDASTIDGWIASGAVRIVTIAPELPGAIEAIGRLAAAGIVVSVGHTDADAATARTAVDAGARMATHLFNAMPPFGHRVPGAAGALLDDERVTLGLLVDGHHLDPTVVRIVARAAHGRVALVSDAIAALGLGEGRHRLAEREVVVAEGAARLADGTLAGSAAGLDDVVRDFAGTAGSVRAAVEAATATPARLLGLDDGRGSLAVGGRADVVLLDERLRVRLTVVGGEVAWSAEDLTWD